MSIAVKAERLLLGMLLLVTAAACRSHVTLCDDRTCDASSAGQPAGTGVAGQGGAAGAGSEHACSLDAECRDDLQCNGIETCLDGACVDGEAPTCPARMHCVENQAAPDPCVYDDPSPWLLVAAGGQLLAIPRAEIGQRDPLVLSEREFDPGYLRGYAAPVWSPDGAHAIVGTREDDFGLSFAEVHFGRGNPAPAAFLRDVPRWSIFSEDYGFAPDSRRAFVHDLDAGLFLVSFAEPPEPSLLLPDAVPGTFCSDASTWVHEDLRMSLSEGELSRSVLSGSGTVSPDGRFVVEAGVEATLGRCNGGSAAAPLGTVDEVVFSPSSAHVWLAEAGGTSRILSIADPAEPVKVWSAGDVADIEFSPSGTRVLVTAADDANSFLKLDGDNRALPIPLTLSAEVEVLSLADDGVLASRPVADGGAELIWIPFDAESRAQSLLTHRSEGSWLVSASRPDLHLFLVEPSAFVGERPLVLVTAGEQGLAARTIETVAQETVVYAFSPSPDGRGVALSITDFVSRRRAIWVPLDEQGVPGELVTLTQDAVGLEFQPWP